MEQMPSNAPIMEPKPGPAGWLPVWIKVVSQPNEQTFVDITEHPDAQPRTAYTWIFLVSTLSTIVNGIVQAILVSIGFGGQSGLGDAGAFVGGSLIAFICLSPVAGAFSVLFFALGVAIVQWVAKLFGGTGTYDKLVYASAAISVPVTLISVILLPFSAIPFVNLCTGLISLGLIIYALFLQATAIKAINRFGWGQAIGSVLIIPGSLFLCSCLVIGILTLMGPAIGNVFSQINQSLAP